MDLFITVMLVATFVVVLIPIINHKKVTNGIINYDNNMRKYVYKVNLSKKEIIKLLSETNEFDELNCTFNQDETIIKFSKVGSNIKYYFHVYEHNDYSLLMLEQASKFGNYLQYKLNVFFVNKLNAEIVPFSLHKF